MYCIRVLALITLFNHQIDSVCVCVCVWCVCVCGCGCGGWVGGCDVQQKVHLLRAMQPNLSCSSQQAKHQRRVWKSKVRLPL